MESGRFDLAAQQRWLLAGGDAPESSCTLMVDDARINLDSLRDALLAEVAKHEILRTRFDIPAGMRSAVQVVESEPKLGWGIEPASDAALRCEATQHDGSITFSLRASAAIADSSTLLAIGMDAIRVAAGEANDSDDEPRQLLTLASQGRRSPIWVRHFRYQQSRARPEASSPTHSSTPPTCNQPPQPARQDGR